MGLPSSGKGGDLRLSKPLSKSADAGKDIEFRKLLNFGRSENRDIVGAGSILEEEDDDVQMLFVCESEVPRIGGLQVGGKQLSKDEYRKLKNEEIKEESNDSKTLSVTVNSEMNAQGKAGVV